MRPPFASFAQPSDDGTRHPVEDYFSPDHLLGRLPRPDEHEPQHLRSDIFDELADHLACAAAREAAAGHDLHKTRRRVLARFGNPAAIAWRLWFDAQKGTIRMQRFTLGAAISSMVLSLVAVGAIVALLMQQSTILAAVTKTSATLEVLAQQQAARGPMLGEPVLPDTANASRSPAQNDVLVENPSSIREIGFNLETESGESPSFAVQLDQKTGANGKFLKGQPSRSAVGKGAVVFADTDAGSFNYSVTVDNGWKTAFTDAYETQFDKSPFRSKTIDLTVPSVDFGARGTLELRPENLGSNRFDDPGSKFYQTGARLALMLTFSHGRDWKSGDITWAPNGNTEEGRAIAEQVEASSLFLQKAMAHGTPQPTRAILLTSAAPGLMQIERIPERLLPAIPGFGGGRLGGGGFFSVDSDASDESPEVTLAPLDPKLSLLPGTYYGTLTAFLVPIDEKGRLVTDSRLWIGLPLVGSEDAFGAENGFFGMKNGSVDTSFSGGIKTEGSLLEEIQTGKFDLNPFATNPNAAYSASVAFPIDADKTTPFPVSMQRSAATDAKPDNAAESGQEAVTVEEGAAADEDAMASPGEPDSRSLGNRFNIVVRDAETKEPMRVVVSARRDGTGGKWVESEPEVSPTFAVDNRGRYHLSILTESGLETQLFASATPFGSTNITLTAPADPEGKTGQVDITGIFDLVANQSPSDDLTKWLMPSEGDRIGLLLTPSFRFYETDVGGGTNETILWWPGSTAGDRFPQHQTAVRFLVLGDGRTYRINGGPPRELHVETGVRLATKTFPLNSGDVSTTELDGPASLPIGSYQFVVQPVALPPDADPVELDALKLLAYDEDILQMVADDPRPLSTNEAFRVGTPTDNHGTMREVTITEDGTATLDLTFPSSRFDYDAVRQETVRASQSGAGFF